MKVNQRAPRHGFVIVMVLVLIVLAGLILAGTARYSLRLALEAAESQEDLQLRWGLFSCQQAYAARSSVIFAHLRDQGAEASVPVAGARDLRPALKLGELHFDLQLADENCKLNLNSFYHEGDRQTVGQLVREMGNHSLPVVLRPYRMTNSDRFYPAFDSWGQVFALDRAGTSDLNDSIPRRLARATGQLTCWGDGRLNVLWAPKECVEQVCRLSGEDRTASRLLELRSQVSPPKLREMLDSLQVRETQRRQLEQMLTDRSRCFSLWIAASNGRRHWHELHIATSDSRGVVHTFGFTW